MCTERSLHRLLANIDKADLAMFIVLYPIPFSFTFV